VKSWPITSDEETKARGPEDLNDEYCILVRPTIIAQTTESLLFKESSLKILLPIIDILST